MRNRKLLLLPSFLILALPSASCVATTTGTSQSAQGCPEFQQGQAFDGSAMIDARARAFVQAAADLGVVAVSLEGAVKTACIGIAGDLGAPDTWTALGDTDDAISNGNGTGACDAARARIVAIMNANPDANFALAISRGECHTDFDAEAQCEAGCNAQTKCDPGTVQTRCDPAQLSVMCEGNCSAQATCEGTATAQANCEGSCEAECTGHCSGTCVGENGKKTEDDPNCHGKCKDHCSGTCSGSCKVDASGGIQCGASVYCKGGCSAMYTQPRCETECTPPTCTIDESCFESCRASVSAKTICDPPTVKLLADASAGPDVAKLVATIDKNLPPLIQSAEAQGQILVSEVQNLGASAKVIVDGAGTLDLKSAACAAAAAESLGKTTVTLQVSTQAGAGVTGDCSSRAD
jgi:hypothetical protein